MKRRLPHVLVLLALILIGGTIFTSSFFAIKDRFLYSESALSLRQTEQSRMRHLLFVDHRGLKDLFNKVFGKQVEFGSLSFSDGGMLQRGGLFGFGGLVTDQRDKESNTYVSRTYDWFSFNVNFVYRDGSDAPISYEIRMFRDDNNVEHLFTDELKNTVLSCRKSEAIATSWRGQRVEIEKLGNSEFINISGKWPPEFVAVPLNISDIPAERVYVGDLVRLGDALKSLCNDESALVAISPPIWGGFSKSQYSSGCTLILQSKGKYSVFHAFANEFNGVRSIQLDLPTFGNGAWKELDAIFAPGWIEKLNGLTKESPFGQLSQSRLEQASSTNVSIRIDPANLGRKQTRLEHALGWNRSLSPFKYD